MTVYLGEEYNKRMKASGYFDWRCRADFLVLLWRTWGRVLLVRLFWSIKEWTKNLIRNALSCLLFCEWTLATPYNWCYGLFVKWIYWLMVAVECFLQLHKTHADWLRSIFHTPLNTLVRIKSWSSVPPPGQNLIVPPESQVQQMDELSFPVPWHRSSQKLRSVIPLYLEHTPPSPS